MIKLKLNRKIRYGKKVFDEGKVIKLDVDADGKITDSFWAKRLVDSEIDNCVEVVVDKVEKKPEKPKSESK